MSDPFRLADQPVERLRPFFQSHGKPRVDKRRVLSGNVFVNLNAMCWRYAERLLLDITALQRWSRRRCYEERRDMSRRD